jgi:hypothetical protein
MIDPSSHAELPAQTVDLASDQWTEGGAVFAVPPGVRTGLVVLAYRRVPGTVRIEGTIRLRNIELERLQ